MDHTRVLRTGETIITADAGYHSEENLRGLCERAVPAMIADGLMRKRDPRFAGQARHKARPDALYDKTPKQLIVKFGPKDFTFDPLAGTCLCPAGKKLYSTGSACSTNGASITSSGALSVTACRASLGHVACVIPNARRPVRGVLREEPGFATTYTQLMKQAVDSERGKALYGRRIATVGPVFANLRYNKRLDRFTLRTQPKVNTRWHLYCLVHNIETLAHLGCGAKVAGSAARG